MPDNASLRQSIISEMHDTPLYGHGGTAKTKRHVEKLFWWPRMVQDIGAYVKNCPSCQVNKSSTQKPAGLLQPLPVPSETWQVVTMDYIMALPRTLNGHTALLVVVDKLSISKMTHLIPTTVQVTGEETARLYVDHVVKLHGVPQAIVSDRDKRFTGQFASTLCKILGIKQRLSTAFHPQTDGQTERINRTLEDMIRHFVSPHQEDGMNILPWQKLPSTTLIKSPSRQPLSASIISKILLHLSA